MSEVTDKVKQATELEPVVLEMADGKEYALVFDGVAMMALDELLGINFLDGKFVPNNAKRLRAMLWACSRTYHEELTLQDIGDLVTSEYLPAVSQALYSLLLSPAANENPDVLAPFVPSQLTVIEEAFKLVDLKPGQVVADLGCGDGRVLAKAYSVTGAKVIGYEMDPGRAKLSRDLLTVHKADFEIHEKRLQDADLSAVDVVFVYLLTASNDAIKPLLQTMRPGSRVVSHDFVIPGWKALASHRFAVPEQLMDDVPSNHSVHVYEIAEEMPK